MARINPLKKTTNIFKNDETFLDLFTFNLFSENIEFARSPEWDHTINKGKTIDDDDLTQIKYYLSIVHDWEPSKYIIGETCFLISKQKAYHPVKQFIESQKWDSTPRLDEWLIHTTKCVDNRYTRQVGAKFLIAAVNRVYNPGCKFDHMLILEGEQGIGKSTMIEELAGDFYLDTSFENKDKDLVESMCRALLVEISELSGLTKKDVDWMKSFIVRKVDRIRLPYAARTKDFHRKCVFIGTYNPSGNNAYLRDDTGNRRFWPVECNAIDVDYVRKNKYQLWAEAYERYKQGEVYHLQDADVIKIMTDMHGDRELESPTFIKIKQWLEAFPRNEVSMMEIIEDCLKINTDGKMPRDLVFVSSPIGIIMKKLGWKKGNNENRNIYYNPNYKKPEVEWDE